EGEWARTDAFIWIRTVGLVLLYYVFSIGITFYNKWLMKGFHYPLFMTLVHLTINFCLSALTRRAMQCWMGKPRIVLSWTDYIYKVAPTAFATALDIGLSNWSFLFITISLYTMTKSSAVLFILFFSLLFKLEEPNPFLILVVLLISSGLFMFTFKSTQFNLEGFVMVLLASFIGGIRWTLTQVLMQKAELGLQNPIDAMYHLQPLMFLGLFPLFLCSLLFQKFWFSCCLIGQTLKGHPFCSIVCSFLLYKMNIVNWLGFAVCLSGISLHVGLKTYYSKNKGPSLRHLNTKSPELELPLLRQNGDKGDDSAADDDEEQEITLH
uniref:Solute carrier family 35 member C2 n=1 Tax=Acanthochromis polyacanthus TaxID=80966 RepID=A0A3Q1FH39_9TELE